MAETKQTKAFDRNELWKDLAFLSEGQCRKEFTDLFPMLKKYETEKISKYIPENFGVTSTPYKELDNDGKERQLWCNKFIKVFNQYNEALKNKNTEFMKIFNFWLSLFKYKAVDVQKGTMYSYKDFLLFDLDKVLTSVKVMRELFSEVTQYAFLKSVKQHINRLPEDDKKQVKKHLVEEKQEIALYRCIAENKNATHKDLKDLLQILGAFDNDINNYSKIKEALEKGRLGELNKHIIERKRQYLSISRDYIDKIKVELDRLLKMDPIKKAASFDNWFKSVKDLVKDGECAAQRLFVDKVNVGDQYYPSYDGYIWYYQNSEGKGLCALFDEIEQNLNNTSAIYISTSEKEIEELQKQLLKANNEITARDRTIAMNKSTIETQKKAIEARDDIIAKQQILISDYGDNAKAYAASRVKGRVYGHNSDDAKYKKAEDGAESLGIRAEDLAKLVAQLEH